MASKAILLEVTSFLLAASLDFSVAALHSFTAGCDVVELLSSPVVVVCLQGPLSL